MYKNNPCRLCLSEYNVNVPIFGYNNNSQNNDVLEKIHHFTPIEISEDDSMPKYICNSCLKLLELFHQFSVTTANSEIKLLQAISTAAATKSSNTSIATTTRCRDAGNPSIGRVFSYTETLRLRKVSEEDPESIIYFPAEKATTPRIQQYKAANENDSYENIFYTFRNCYSVEAVNTVNNYNYVMQKNSPNILLPQLRSRESISEIELNCEDMEDKEEIPKLQDIEDGLPEGVPIQNIIRIPEYACNPCDMEHNLACLPFNFDEYLDSDGESQDIQNLNSEIFHSGFGYIPDLDRDLQVTLVDEHLLPLSLVTKKHAPLRWLLDHYCKLSGNAPNQIGIRYNGRLIKDSTTGCELGLRHGALLYVVLLWQQPQVIVAEKIRFYNNHT